MRSVEFEDKVLPLKGCLYRFAKSILNNREEAEDCVQEIFLKLWTKRESLAHIKNIKAFSLQMTRNFCLDKLKTRKHTIGEAEEEILTTDINPHRQAELNDAIVWIQKIINHLPEQQRTAIHLRSIEGLEMKEIAEVTGLNISHVRVILSRARITIREIYQKYYTHE